MRALKALRDRSRASTYAQRVVGAAVAIVVSASLAIAQSAPGIVASGDILSTGKALEKLRFKLPGVTDQAHQGQDSVNGVVYEKNLGKKTTAIVSELSIFNPDSSWKKSPGQGQ